jgi:hypothetical protein
MDFHNPYVPMYSMYHLAQETLKTKEAELSGEQTRSQSLKVPLVFGSSSPWDFSWFGNES